MDNKAYICSLFFEICTKSQNRVGLSEERNLQTYHFVLVGAVVVLFGSRNEKQNVGKGFDSIGISPHHHVSEPNVVVGCDMAGSYTSKQSLRNSSAPGR